jgi:transposase InsO family protein
MPTAGCRPLNTGRGASGTLCLQALHKAQARAGRVPEIFNTDQGGQFTSEEWTTQLTNWGVKISMDGRGRWMCSVPLLDWMCHVDDQRFAHHC